MEFLELEPLLLACQICGRMSVNIDTCERCGKYACPGCIREEYNPFSFSYYDGSVEIDVHCAACLGFEPEVGVYL